MERSAWASASSLRLFRSLALALGFAVLLAAAPGASVVSAVAAPGDAAVTADASQEPVDPADDPSNQPFIPPTDEGDEGDEEDEAEPDSIPTMPMKTDSIAPDSLRSGAGSSIPSGAAPAETLGYKAPGVPGARVAPVPPKGRGTPFGIHPAALFAILIVGHVFLVRLVSD